MKLIVFCVLVSAFLCGGLVLSCSSTLVDEQENVDHSLCKEEPLDVHLKIVDKRWCKEGGYAMPRLSVYLKKDLALLVEKPLLKAFEKNNLSARVDGVEVYFEIEQFFCDLNQRRSSWNCVSEILMEVKVFGPEKKIYYEKRLSGIAENDFDFAEKNGKSKKALDTSVDNAMENLLGDKAFRRAIKKASGDFRELNLQTQ